ncbi:MAG TPA: DUF885 domain-containing protein [Acidimicrobiia bacterium]
MTTPFEISDRLCEDISDLIPVAATFYGIPGRDHLWGDFSPTGQAAVAELSARYIAELAPHLDHHEEKQRLAARAITADLQEKIDRFDAGEHLIELNHIFSPPQVARDVFDVMDPSDDKTWQAIVTRLDTISEPLIGYRDCLQAGLDSGQVVAKRQVESVIQQCRSLASDESRFLKYVAMADELNRDVEGTASAVESARRAYDSLANWLESDYLPNASEADAVGRERYLRATEYFLGIGIDLDETYGWGWSEVHRLRSEMERTAAEIDPDKSIAEVIEMLDTDPERMAPSHEAFAEFVEGIQAEAVDQLSGEHFDVPTELRKVTVNIAPGDGALGAWYHGPSEDLSRPGSIWYAPGSRTAIPVWQEVSTAYHEGFPGHHLQVGIGVMLRDEVSRYHRLFMWKSGAGEGWALYAERLMEELGYFANAEYRLGLYASQLFRATRVVVDIGTQLGLVIPDDAPLYPGEVWNHDIAVDYMEKVGLQERDVAESEVKRYLGWYGQAISYKVGEREILKMREERMTKDGVDFDVKEFHKDLLRVGAIRLDQVREYVLA